MRRPHKSGLARRLESDLTARLPYGSPMRVVASERPALDPWRGAAHVAGCAFGGGAGGGWGGALTRDEYEERGPEYVKEYAGVVYW
jgi:actin-related protein